MAIAACGFLAALPVSARGRKQMAFRVDLRSGKVESLASVAPPSAAPPWPAPHGDPRRTITSDERTLSLREGDLSDPSAQKVIWQLTVPGTGAGWIPWQVVQGNTVVYAWREDVPGQRYQYRDVTRAIDVASRSALWERVDPAHDPPGAAAVGTDHLVIDQNAAVLLVETRTGRVVRQIAKAQPSFAVASPVPGRLWLEAGDAIECVDEATLTVAWRIPKQGALVALLPIAGAEDWLIKTTDHTYRVHAAHGRIVWSATSPSSARPVIDGMRIYEPALEVEDHRRGAQISIVARDARTGQVLRTYAIARHDTFFDQARLAAIAVHNGQLDMSAEFTVLD